MINESKARELVEQIICGYSSPEDDEKYVINEHHSIEKDWGWIIYWTSEKWLAGDERYAIGGNAPFIVTKDEGKVLMTGTAYSIEHYIAAFEACGDPNAELSQNIHMYGWEVGAQKVPAVKCIRKMSGLGLKESKSLVDRVLADEAVYFLASTIENGQNVVKSLKELGFKSEQLWSNQC